MRDVNEGGTHTHIERERDRLCGRERVGGVRNNKRGGRGEQ